MAFENHIDIQPHLAILHAREVLLQILLSLKLNNSKIDVDLIVGNEGILLIEKFLSTIYSIKFYFPVVLSQMLDDVRCQLL